jgi:hypothetical protein
MVTEINYAGSIYCPVKGIADVVAINHKTCEIIVIDYKAYTGKFIDRIVEMNYDRQMEFYKRLLLRIHGFQYRVSTFLAAVSTNSYRTEFYQLYNDAIVSQENEFYRSYFDYEINIAELETSIGYETLTVEAVFTASDVSDSSFVWKSHNPYVHLTVNKALELYVDFTESIEEMPEENKRMIYGTE